MTEMTRPPSLQLTARERKDLNVLIQFTAVFCAGHHHPHRSTFDPGLPALGFSAKKRKLELCPDCAEFLAYAISRRLKCPLPEKPSCKHCHIHCYRAGHREKVRDIMRYSGRRLILRGRLDLLWHYLF